MKSNIKYKFLEKNTIISLNKIDAKNQEKPTIEYESEKIFLQQKINNKPNLILDEKKEKDLSKKPIKPSQYLNLQFNEKPEQFTKTINDDDSFDEYFIKTLQKNDIDYLKQSLMNFNIKDSSGVEQNVKKYNNSNSFYPDDFDKDEETSPEEIPELIETNNLKKVNTNEKTANFSFSQNQNEKKPENVVVNHKKLPKQERIQSAKEVSKTRINQMKISENEFFLRKSSESFKQNTNTLTHPSPKICKTVFSEKFGLNIKKEATPKKLDEKSKNLEKIVKKIEKLDEFKRIQLEKLLDKIEEGSLELESLINFDFSTKKPKIQIIENYQIGLKHPEVNILIIKPMSSWNQCNLIGLTEIQLYDNLSQLIQINNIIIKNGPPHIKDVSNIINGVCNTCSENQMWTCSLPQFPLNLEIQISFQKEKCIASIKIWNYNKNPIEASKGVKECEILLNGFLIWKGSIKKSNGRPENSDFVEEINLSENFQNTNKLRKKSFEIQKMFEEHNEKISKRFPDNHDSAPNFSKKNLEMQAIKDKLNHDSIIPTSQIIHKKLPQEFNYSQLSLGKSINNHPKTTPLIFDDRKKSIIPTDQILAENPKKEFVEEKKNFNNHEIISKEELFSQKQNEKKELTPLLFQEKFFPEKDERIFSKQDPKTNSEIINIDNLKKEANFYFEEKKLFKNQAFPTLPIATHEQKNERKEETYQNIQESNDMLSNQSKKKKPNRFDNNLEFLENYNQNSKILENETAKNTNQLKFNPLDTLKFFNLNNDARLIKPQNPSTLYQEYPKTIESLLGDFKNDDDLDYLLSNPQSLEKSPKHPLYIEKHFTDTDFVIPNLPLGRYLTILIYTTWGDTHYVGLSGLELFDCNGAAIKINYLQQIKAIPADINVLPEYGQDPRTIDKLMDGVYMTCDDLHVWLAPFNTGKENVIEIDLLKPHRISMIRIWNYNKSRIHSFRGAKDVKISLDNKTIFLGEIKKAPGNLKSCERFCEYIMLTEDDKILNCIERNDWLNDELKSLPIEEQIEEILSLYERPKTATKFFDEKELNEIQAILNLSQKKQDLLGTDGRPLTLALVTPLEISSNKHKISNGLNDIKQNERKIVKVRNITINLMETWGDKFYIGLCGFEIYDTNNQKIRIPLKNLSAQPRDLNSTPGYEGDPRILENLLDQENITINDKKMWLIPFIKGREHNIFINFQNELLISGIKFWNYNKSIDDLNRGVKLLSIKADGNYITPKEGILIRKGTGNNLFDFGHFFQLPFSEKFEIEKKIISEIKNITNPVQKKIYQHYETTNMPMGFVLKLVLLKTWGDLNYVGLNGIEIYDGKAEPLLFSDKKEIKLIAEPSSINILKGNEKDIRTIDKLINGKNTTYDERNMWLAPYIYGKINEKEKIKMERNTIYISFSSPIIISNINIWNYTKTPGRGVKDLEIYLDENLIYKGSLRKAPIENEYVQGKEIVTSILFTKNTDIIQTLKPIVYEPDNNDPFYSLINEKKIVRLGNLNPENIPKNFKPNLNERPTTGVRGSLI